MRAISTLFAGIAMLLMFAVSLFLSALPFAFAIVIAVWLLRACT